MDETQQRKLDLYNEISDRITEVMALAGIPADEGMLGSYVIIAEHVFIDDDSQSYSNYALLPRGGYLPSHVLLGLLGQAKVMLNDSMRMPEVSFFDSGDDEDDDEDGLTA